MTNNYILTYDDIQVLDIDISNICNLKCPLCPSILYNEKFPKHFIEFDLFKTIIKKFKHIKAIHIAGAASEPTLHPDLFNIIDWLNSMFPNIFINIFTNGSTHNEHYWYQLSKHMTKNFQVIFTVCGTTQRLHEKYRVGSNLSNILKNIEAFKKDNVYKNDYLQYIRFEYNKHESNQQISKFAQCCSNYGIIDTDTMFERYQFDKYKKIVRSNDCICSTKIFSFLYFNELMKLNARRNALNICCNSFISKVVQIDPFGKIWPCVAYRIFSNKDFCNNDILDYNDIMTNKVGFCYECDKCNLHFLDKHNIDPFYMCDIK